ncbi:MAG: 2-oxoglutarate dehydrogenase, E2 component, dihydrolipoamide succinyltransferase [Holophagales bacterium]|nr:MAG: 2-oxoglutarate dehydrogenase, E2 component, dihydrolipoamide succinyltransferase [Holophagales bacterium]
MASDVVMPQMGESIAEGTITRWLVKPGEKVERDQPLFEISTDKVDAEIPSPDSGVLLEVLFPEGATVPVHTVVARIGAGGEGSVSPAPKAPAEPAPAPIAVAAAAPAAASAVSPVPVPAAPAAAAAPADDPQAALQERLRSFSSPLVRSIAAKEGVDLAQVVGTGIHGRVTKQDIEGFLERRQNAPAPVAPAPAVAAMAPPPAGVSAPAGGKVDTGFHVAAYTANENVTIEPMSKIRQITAAHMRYSKDTSAHVTTVFHMDFSKVHAAREKAKGKFAAVNGTKLSYMPFIFKAVAAGLKANPKLNASIDGTNVVFKKDIHLGMAVALDWGLIVPVLRHADQLNLVGLAKGANDLADRARAKKLSPDEVKGGTFTITNPGVFGSLFGTPIINQPQVAILGIGMVEKRPMVETDADGNDHLVIKPMAYFGITYDHRLVDGADADHFMNAVKKALLGPWPELEPYA